MNTDSSSAFKALQAPTRHAHAPKHLCPAPAKTECDYTVHFVCRHLPDRCICWANLDGFTGWILNQKRILAPAGEGERRHVAAAMPRTSDGNHSSTRPHLEGGIASDCYPRRVWSCGDEWERNAPVFMNISYWQCRNASSFCAIVIPTPCPNFSPTKEIWKLLQSPFFHVGISFLLLIVAGYWSAFFSLLTSVTWVSLLIALSTAALSPFLFLSFLNIFVLCDAFLPDLQSPAFFNLFHSMMNIQRKQQFSCMAVKSHVCLLKGLVHLICELTE